MSDLSLLSGVKRKSDFGAVRSAFDPKRAFALRHNGSSFRSRNTEFFSRLGGVSSKMFSKVAFTLFATEIEVCRFRIDSGGAGFEKRRVLNHCWLLATYKQHRSLIALPHQRDRAIFSASGSPGERECLGAKFSALQIHFLIRRLLGPRMLSFFPRREENSALS